MILESVGGPHYVVSARPPLVVEVHRPLHDYRVVGGDPGRYVLVGTGVLVHVDGQAGICLHRPGLVDCLSRGRVVGDGGVGVAVPRVLQAEPLGEVISGCTFGEEPGPGCAVGSQNVVSARPGSLVVEVHGPLGYEAAC